MKHRLQIRKPRKRRRGTARLFVLGAAFMASAAVGGRLATPAYAQSASQGPATPAPRLTLDLPAGTIGSVVAALRAVAGVEIATANDMIEDLPSPGVRGTFTLQQALDQLLAGTGVGFTFTADRTVMLDLRASEFVTVEGRQPTVASPKFTRPLRDIPQTIAVVPKEIIQAQAATTLRDVLRNVPGITFQAGEGGGGLPGDNFTMRGFSAGNDVFIDGVRDTGGYSRDAFNLEQVEVAKGPSSSISGRGSTGGAINQVTKSPFAQGAYSGSIAVGNADYRRGTLDVNQPIGDSNAAFRLNAMWMDAGVPGRDVVENSGWGVAPSLGVGLGGPTQVVLKYQHLTQDNVPDYGLPWGSSAGFPTGAFQASPPVDQSNFYGLRDYDFEDIRSDVATAEVSHRFANAVTLRNTTRYSDTERDSAITAPRPPNRQLQRRRMGTGNIANLTNVSLSLRRGRVGHDLVGGVEVSRETTDNRNSAQNTSQPQTSLPRPNPDDRPLGPMPAITGNPSETNLTMVGAYLFDTISVGERWEVTGGARWDGVEGKYQLTTRATGEITRIDSSDSMVSWRGGVVYKPRPNGSVYVGYGTSFNPSIDAASTGAALSTSPTAANNPHLDPEESRNYEVGTKWDALGGRLSLNGAIFRTEKVNARTRNANSEPFVLDGKQRVQGVELGASGTITDRWTALAAYAYMDSAIEASANAAEEGQNLALTPKSTFSLWTSVQLPGRVTVGGGTQFMDAVFRNATNTTSVPSYWLLNALVSYEVNSHLTLRLNGQNLGDEQYVDRVGGGHYIPGPRRQVLLSSDVRF